MGVLEPGSRMPSVRQTAMELSINPNTIQRAYMQLEQEGLIYPVKGTGNFIADSEEVRKLSKASYIKRTENPDPEGKGYGNGSGRADLHYRGVLQGGEAMIEVKECSKAFGTVKAVNKATLDVGVREVFGLVGSNGAGKSTLLRMMAGIIKPDEGEIQIDGMPVYENEEAKKLFFYISDDSYFPANYTAMDLVRFYRNFYPQFRTRFFHELMEQFHLEENRRIATFSKGMKKQVLVIIGVCAATKYLFCDETFDGLDPVMRQAVKSLFAAEIMNREFTPVIASHNLRELEDICDHVGLFA